MTDISNLSSIKSAFNAKMNPADFKRISNYIYSELGIKMPEAKKVMLESRLQKRLKELGIATFSEYAEFVFSPKGMETEIIHMIDVVTTNKTDFFREPQHFDFLSNIIVPEFTQNNRGKALNIWSAGCSSGEEPYTICMVLQDLVEKNLLFDYSIFGTDISTHILGKAIQAIYHESRVSVIPLATKKKYLLKSKDPLSKTVRIIPELRSKVSYQRVNFMDDSFEFNNLFDIVFCRNVIIYFDRQTQEKVINKLCSKLKKGGYFFLGHSESITNMNVPLQHIKPTIFRKI